MRSSGSLLFGRLTDAITSMCPHAAHGSTPAFNTLMFTPGEAALEARCEPPVEQHVCPQEGHRPAGHSESVYTASSVTEPLCALVFGGVGLTLLLSSPSLWCSGVLLSDDGLAFSLLLLESLSLMMSYCRQNRAITAAER
ncbi:hypothetical protein EYF80_007112 [Liparis tanakae]|uniref:Uncharacterized protein n=1 Tax=Liparis tanakae TaxID=230148 RepID=A0A4Z2IYI6_9TELE|nr:hypothetical protein EYF80_007112 [Liparis tanakae]